jgi:hypothetical protein
LRRSDFDRLEDHSVNVDYQWRGRVGTVGETAVKKELETRGWLVTDLNALRRNEPNVDLVARKDELTVYIQVKAYNDYGWISGGGINAEVCDGGSLFNKAKNAPLRCDFVICPTPASPGDKKIVRNDWRYFVMPVDTADRLFRININAYSNSPKLDGSPAVYSKRVETQEDRPGDRDPLALPMMWARAWIVRSLSLSRRA